MLEALNPYQMVLFTLMACWFVPLIIIWVRYDRLPHCQYLLIAIAVWPTTLVDEVIRGYDWAESWIFAGGVFQFSAALVATMLLLSIRKLTVEKPLAGEFKYYLPAVVLFAGQIPFMLLPLESKLQMLMVPPTGDLLTNWIYYVPYFFSGFIILVFATRAVELVGTYHESLSDQVVDVGMYRFNLVNSGFVSLIVVAFAVIILTTLATFNILAPVFWQSMINLFQSATLLYLILVMLERRRYAPSPIDPDLLDSDRYSEDYLRFTLKKAEEAIIQYKAYKRMGLRIRQLSDAADIEPQALAIATRKILNRNFRAFIYHYRLEYAKKVLMRTDAKVSTVAKRLGFNSEKYLSNMFIKYIEVMGKQRPPPEEEESLL